MIDNLYAFGGIAVAVFLLLVCAEVALSQKCLYRWRPPERKEAKSIRDGSRSANEVRAGRGYQPYPQRPVPPPPRYDNVPPALRDRNRNGVNARYTDGEGFLNVYETVGGRMHPGGCYRSKTDADRVAKPHRRAVVKVTWPVGESGDNFGENHGS